MFTKSNIKQKIKIQFEYLTILMFIVFDSNKEKNTRGISFVFPEYLYFTK